MTKTTKRRFLRAVGASSLVVVFGGCLSQSSGTGDESTDTPPTDTTSAPAGETTTSTVKLWKENAGMSVTNYTDTERTVIITVTAVESGQTTFDESFTVASSDDDGDDWHRGFGNVFPGLGTYEVYAETDDGGSKTERTTHDENGWYYLGVSLSDSGIEMNGVFR